MKTQLSLLTNQPVMTARDIIEFHFPEEKAKERLEQEINYFVRQIVLALDEMTLLEISMFNEEGIRSTVIRKDGKITYRTLAGPSAMQVLKREITLNRKTGSVMFLS